MYQDSVSLRTTDPRQRRRFRIANRSFLDFGVAGIEGGLAAAMVILMNLIVPEAMPWGPDAPVLATSLGVGAAFAFGAYRPAARFVETLDSTRVRFWQAPIHFALAMGFVWLATLLAGLPFTPFPATGWLWLAIGAASVSLWRWMIYQQLLAMMSAGQFQLDRTALIGNREDISKFERENRIWQRGGQVVARLDLGAAGANDVASRIGDFVRNSIDMHCDRVLVIGARDDAVTNTAVLSTLHACRSYAIDVGLAPLNADGQGETSRLLDVLPLGADNAIYVLQKPLRDRDLVVKRLLDITVAGTALLLSLPLLIAVAVSIRLSGPGPVLFRQERRGFNGHPFNILKFRSMNVTEAVGAMTPAVEGDSRITPIGRFIRRTSIDELPQLLNVLAGEMSIVGPRPHATYQDVALQRRFDRYAARQRIKPGITGWAQVNGYRGEMAEQHQIEGRVMHDLDYIENWSLAFDLKILWLTVFSAKAHRNAF